MSSRNGNGSSPGAVRDGFSPSRDSGHPGEASNHWETQGIYDRLSTVYDLVFKAFFRPGKRRAIERLRCRAGDRVLEIGVGTGTSLSLYPEGVRVTGVDLSRGMLRRARRRLREEPVSCSARLARMDAQRLAFREASFDKVVAFHVVSVLPDPVKAVEEMDRVCRPGGDLIIVNHFQSEHPLVSRLESALTPLTRRMGWRTDLGLDPLVEAADLDVEIVEPVNLLGYWSLVHARKEERHGAPARS